LAAAPFKSSGREATVTLSVDLDPSQLTFNAQNGLLAGADGA